MVETLERLRRHGWVRLPGCVSADRLPSLRCGLERAQEACREVRARKGLLEGASGTAHHLVVCDPLFVQLLEELDLDCVLRPAFRGAYILNSFGGVCLGPDTSYVAHFHRDVRTFVREFHLMVNVIVMLDDFTLENGATRFIRGSHLQPGPPEDPPADRIDHATGTAGDAVIFDSNLWHASGSNSSGKPRRALTLTFTKPFVKQQMDYPRALGYEAVAAMPARTQQLLGYNARVPANLDEWYRPIEQRMYRSDQE